MFSILKIISVAAIPMFIFIILGYGYIKGIKVYEVFVEGAKKGFATAIRIMPYLIAMFIAIGAFRSSGVMNLIVKLISPVVKTFAIPPELIPLALMRPLSGIASAGLLAEMFKVYSPDSMLGRMASTMMGSTETIFYTISVYFGSVGIKRVRYTLYAALIADTAGFLASVYICRLIFSY